MFETLIRRHFYLMGALLVALALNSFWILLIATFPFLHFMRAPFLAAYAPALASIPPLVLSLYFDRQVAGRQENFRRVWVRVFALYAFAYFSLTFAIFFSDISKGASFGFQIEDLWIVTKALVMGAFLSLFLARAYYDFRRIYLTYWAPSVVPTKPAQE